MRLEAPFVIQPEVMAGRILGLGDMVGRFQEAQRLVSEKEQQRLQKALTKRNFSLTDFRNQMQRVAQPSLMLRMLGILPGVPKEFKEMLNSAEASSEIRGQMSIIDSMTPEERRNPKIIEVSRRQRIAKGAGVHPKQVKQLIKEFDMMKRLLGC